MDELVKIVSNYLQNEAAWSDISDASDTTRAAIFNVFIEYRGRIDINDLPEKIVENIGDLSVSQTEKLEKVVIAWQEWQYALSKCPGI